MLRMKLLSVVALLSTIPLVAEQGVRVDGYTRRDGTNVDPHYRSAPDNRYNNNYGTSPNINPYTGRQGTNQPTWNDGPPPSNLYGNTYGTPRR